MPVQEMWVSTLGGEYPLEKEMASRSSILAWRIPWTEEPGGLQSMGSQRVGHDSAQHIGTHQHFTLLFSLLLFLFFISRFDFLEVSNSQQN